MGYSQRIEKFSCEWCELFLIRIIRNIRKDPPLDNHLYFILGTGAGVARQKVLQLKSAKVLPITPITPLTLSLELKHILFFFLTKIADGTKTLVWIKSRHNFFFHENCRWHNNSGGVSSRHNFFSFTKIADGTTTLVE